MSRTTLRLCGRLVLYGGAASLVLLVLLGAYWVSPLAPLPTIIEPAEGTYAHRGVDARGYTATRWKSAGHDLETWKPAPLISARPGETVWIRRDLTFPNKTSGDITRVFVCEGGYHHMFPTIKPPTRTEGREVKHFPLVIPPGAAGKCYYEVAALFYGNPLRPEVRVAFRPVSVWVEP